MLERGDKPEKGGWGKGFATFFTTLQFSQIYSVCGESKVSLYYFSDRQSFELAIKDFHPRFHSSPVLKPGIICAFLIHFVSLQEMLTALFNLV